MLIGVAALEGIPTRLHTPRVDICYLNGELVLFRTELKMIETTMDTLREQNSWPLFGIPIAESRRETGARSLLGFLRDGGQLDPVLVALLRDALASMEARSVPAHLEDVVDWVGQSEFARGRALRGLLRTASRIARSRPSLRSAPIDRFPRFSSGIEPS